MRVISGSKRHMLLETPAGMNTRPTTDQIKETLFNMIAPDIYGADFLDIFGGSGQMGIEALSRGASHAWFIEKDFKACKCIRSNLTRCGLLEQAELIQADYKSALISPKMPAHVDIVFMDPPYDHLYEKDVLTILKEQPYVDLSTLIIIEASKDTSFDYLDEMGYMVIKQKFYKTNQHMFVALKE